MKTSAGLLLYRGVPGATEVLLVHPGGPFWARKDDGAWSIPKGEIAPGEKPIEAAFREFAEETGTTVTGDALPLQPCRQAGGKTVHAWAIRFDLDPATVRSNTLAMEWPPRSGRQVSFPEIDRAAWFPLDVARRKINQAQAAFLKELEQALERRSA